ncbi:oxidoreductase family protein [Aliiglaciecola lipolytica]|uniref:CHK kinase-like domain-containing protein n=1 Tax=Aliiglaciecola lipolytica E3 TaxID=1127673 RepID=K6YC24_9ALTE|nr:oxidoreductase family protein [Aliiglaciecola lipolytica]GAC15752.1 hypothetical protein GLIP_3131 [Aliiglaciecola lipolytica E3]
MSQHYQVVILELLQHYFSDKKVSKVEAIQSLWSGYGEIARYWVPSKKSSYVVKAVNPNAGSQHPRGWNTSISHQRKMNSYQNEQLFYQHYSPMTNALCRVPICYAVGKSNQVSWLIMEDLDQSGFINRCDHAPLSMIKLGIRWLAYFHARFLEHQTTKLWPIGTYWHLKTRPDEFQKMSKGELKNAAFDIDKALNAASHQALLHGDAKLANLCFTTDNDNLAAVDFQYVGKGIGMKDVAYFLGSCLDERGLFEHAEDLLNQYFGFLLEAINYYQISYDFDSLEKQWRTLYPLAWADFNRFLSGWAVEHYKLNDYMKLQTELALHYLSNQHKTGS